MNDLYKVPSEVISKLLIKKYKEELKEANYKLGQSDSYISELIYCLNQDKPAFFRNELRVMNIHYMHKIKELNNKIKMQEKIINKLLVQNENLRNK